MPEKAHCSMMEAFLPTKKACLKKAMQSLKQTIISCQTIWIQASSKQIQNSPATQICSKLLKQSAGTPTVQIARNQFMMPICTMIQAQRKTPVQLMIRLPHTIPTQRTIRMQWAIQMLLTIPTLLTIQTLPTILTLLTILT